MEGALIYGEEWGKLTLASIYRLHLCYRPVFHLTQGKFATSRVWEEEIGFTHVEEDAIESIGFRGGAM